MNCCANTLENRYTVAMLQIHLSFLRRKACCSCLLRQRMLASLSAELGYESSQRRALAVQKTP